MRRALVRFVIAELDPDSRQPTGVFQAAYRLRRSSSIPPQTRQDLKEHIEWFKLHLPEPERFVLTRSKGFYRRKPVAVSWFKAEATEFIARAETLGRIVEAHGFPVQRLTTTHPGYVVYEDAYQVVALPFRDR